MRTVGTGSHGLIDVGIHHFGIGNSLDPAFQSKYAGLGIPYTSAEALFEHAYTPMIGYDAKQYYSGSVSPSWAAGTWSGDKPIPRAFNDISDFGNYGSPWDVLLRRELTDQRFSFQHGVKHLTAVGDIVSKHSMYYTLVKQGSFSNSQEFFWYSSTLGTPSGYDWVMRATSLIDWMPTAYHPIVRSGKIIGQPINTVIQSMSGPIKLQNTFCTTPFVGYGHPTMPSSDVAVRGAFLGNGWYFGDRIEDSGDNWIEFSNFVWRYNNWCRYIRYRLNFWTESRPVVLGNYEHGAPNFVLRARYQGSTYLLRQDSSTLNNLGPDGLRGWAVTDRVDFDRTVTSPSYIFPLSNTYGHGSDAASRLPIVVKTIRKRHELISARAPDIRPASLISFADALSNSRASTTNYLEVAVECRELITLVPSLVGVIKAFLSRKPGMAVKAVSKGVKINKALDASLRLGDLLSDSLLITQFGLKPALSNAQDIRQLTNSVGPRLRALQAPETLHGKFVKTFQHELGPMTLVARTTARVNGLTDDLLLKLMGLDALGLSPRSANIWDLIPWSWFIDQFAGISGKLDAFDAYVLGNMRGVQWCVHSYTLFDEAASDIADSGYQSGHLTIKHYFREVSRLTPGKFVGKYDFLDGRGPDPGITSAIFWMLSKT